MNSEIRLYSQKKPWYLSCHCDNVLLCIFCIPFSSLWMCFAYILFCFIVTYLFVLIVIKIITQWWLIYPFLTFLPIMSVCSVHTSLSMQWNLMRLWCKLKVLLAIKPGLVHHFLHQKMPVPSQEYDSCYPLFWCVCAFESNK